MITSRQSLIKALKTYTSRFSEERNFKEQFLGLLDAPRCYFRDHLPGHLTGSAFIVDESRQFTLLTHHAKLNKWLQPGGHADGDDNISGVALREAMEETGLSNFTVLHNDIFDIDIHLIPARRDFPEHLHFDIRILLQASRADSLVITEESNDLAWIKLDDVEFLTKNNSLTRMVNKVTTDYHLPIISY